MPGTVVMRLLAWSRAIWLLAYSRGRTMHGAYLLAHWSSSASPFVEGVGVDVEAERLGVTCIRATRKLGRPKKRFCGTSHCSPRIIGDDTRPHV